MNEKKLTLDDLTEKDFETARDICHYVMRVQSAAYAPPDYGLAPAILDAVTGATRSSVDASAVPESALNSFDKIDYKDEATTALETGIKGALESTEGLTLAYCGIRWSWWLARYLIADAWGCPLDQDRLKLLHLYCYHCPIWLIDDETKKLVPTKPDVVKYHVTGETAAPFRFPIYELHADGEPAVTCAGLKLYYFHGLKIPEQYGSTKSTEWKPKWWLTEENMEYRRVLAQEIGYDKIATKLDLKERDSWREYTLVRAERVPGEDEAVQFLKMKCPSTAKTHYSRVDPEIPKAEIAATILNGGVHPESFVEEA